MIWKEKFLERTWLEDVSRTYLKQLHAWGFCDSRELLWMKLFKATEVFVSLYEQGLIYRATI